MEQFAKTFQPQKGTNVKMLTVQLVVQDCTGSVKATDTMFQGGEVATDWVAHPSELRWSFDSE